jgi:hypothetical protein
MNIEAFIHACCITYKFLNEASSPYEWAYGSKSYLINGVVNCKYWNNQYHVLSRFMGYIVTFLCVKVVDIVKCHGTLVLWQFLFLKWK